MPIHTLERSSAPQARIPATTFVLLQRIESEFREMPGLILTEDQAKRLWALDRITCHRVLTALVERRFLKRTAGGAYVRSSN